LNDSLGRLAFLDELTGLANRRQFDHRLEAEWSRAIRDAKPIGLIMLDIDFFKLFNDYYGHPAGDACLRQVARAISDSVRRPGDLPARYGGEEFAIILPDTEGQGALFVARAIETAIRNLGLRHENGPGQGIVTVSQGVAVCYPKVGGNSDGLVRAADEALYHAKKAGRARTTMAAA
jgi:diguanylate cyclase (GGDEF)-like protein